MGLEPWCCPFMMTMGEIRWMDRGGEVFAIPLLCWLGPGLSFCSCCVPFAKKRTHLNHSLICLVERFSKNTGRETLQQRRNLAKMPGRLARLSSVREIHQRSLIPATFRGTKTACRLFLLSMLVV